MHKYVLGVMLSSDHKRVVLVRQTKGWQKGMYNAPGGKQEPNEGATRAVVREVYEETGLRSSMGDWEHIGYVQGSNFLVTVFATDKLLVEAVRNQEGDSAVPYLVDRSKMGALPLIDHAEYLTETAVLAMEGKWYMNARLTLREENG